MSAPPAVNITIRQIRESKDLTQLELAELIGTSQAAVARWESGRAMPRLDTLQRIAEALGYTVNVIILAASPPNPPARE